MMLFRKARSVAPILLVLIGGCLEWPDSALNIDARGADAAADLMPSGEGGGEQVPDLPQDRGVADQPVSDLPIVDLMIPDGPAKADQAKLDLPAQDLPKPDQSKPDISKPDQSKPDLPKVKLDGAKPDKPKPDMAKPDMAKPDLLKPDLLKPDLLIPDLLKPDLLIPDQTIADLNMGPLANGKACVLSSQCYSGNCADGYCCDFPCTSPCKQCDAPGKLGICSPVGPGAKPRKGTCTVSTSICGQDGNCDGAGSCRYRVGGVVCKDAKCSTADPTFLDLPHMCDGQGACADLTALYSETECGDYRCDAKVAACYGSCSGSGQCKAGKTCAAGLCNNKLKSLGLTCSLKSECESGKCVQGVCCNNDCNDACKTCKLPGALGRCLPKPYGQKPDSPKSCTVNTPCGEDGFCDGAGKCRDALAGLPCGNLCKNETSKASILVGACDGGGKCGETVYQCGNYKCAASTASCYGRCTSNTHCVAGFTCKGGSCAL